MTVAEFIPYERLTPDERAELHAWLWDHRIDPGRVPIGADFDFDATTGEWRIPQFVKGPGGRGVRVDPVTRDALLQVVRRRELRPLPWPRELVGQAWIDEVAPFWLGAASRQAGERRD